jgi:hypothetical protein
MTSVQSGSQAVRLLIEHHSLTAYSPSFRDDSGNAKEALEIMISSTLGPAAQFRTWLTAY